MSFFSVLGQHSKSIVSTFKEALSEKNGTMSFGRASACAIVLCTLGWVTFVVAKTHTIPDLASPTLFLTSGTAATYGANKVAGAMNKNGDGKADGPGPDPK